MRRRQSKQTSVSRRLFVERLHCSEGTQRVEVTFPNGGMHVLSKHESRNPKQIQSTNDKNSQKQAI